MGPLPTYRKPTVIHLPTFFTTITVANQNQLPQSFENSLIDSEVGSLVNQNQLLQSLKDSLRDTVEESFGDNSLPRQK